MTEREPGDRAVTDAGGEDAVEEGRELVVEDEPSYDESSLVGDAARRLDALSDRPVEEHVEIYEEVHGVLRRSLEGGSADSSP